MFYNLTRGANQFKAKRKQTHVVTPELKIYGKFGLSFKKHWHEIKKATNSSVYGYFIKVLQLI